jgi:hypothetical protein
MLAFRSRGAWGWSKRGSVNDWGPVIFSARSARSVRQRAYATCPTKQNASAPNTVADTRCATDVRRRGATRFPVSEISCHSNGEPACAIRCTGRTPRDRDRAARRIGEAKDACEAALVQALAALRHSPKTWAAWFHQWRENPRELCSDSENWIQGTLAGGIGGLHKAGGWGREGDVHHHPVIAMVPDRHHPLSLALSCWFRQIGDVAMGPI